MLIFLQGCQAIAGVVLPKPKTERLKNDKSKASGDFAQDGAAPPDHVLDALPAPVFYKSRDGVYLGCSRAFAEFLGRDKSEIIGKSARDVSPAGLAEVYEEMDERLFAEGGVQVYESRVETSSGVRYVRFRKSLFHGPDGEVAGLVGEVTDITDVKQAEFGLRYSEARQRALVQTLQEGVWEIDAEAKTVSVNRRMADMLGYTRGEMIGRPLFDFIDERLRADCEQKLEDRARGAHERHEFEFRRKDGGVLHAHLETRPLFDNEGGYRGAVAGVMDIGEIVESRRRSALERDRLGRVLESLDTGLSVIDPDMTIAWVNDKLRRMFPDAEPVGAVCHEFYEKSGEPCADCPTMRAFETGRPQRIERYNPSTGGWYAVISQPIIAHDGSVAQVLEGVTDITESKRAEEAIRASEEKYRLIAEHAADVIWVRNENLDIVYLSPSIESILGYAPEEIGAEPEEKLFTEAGFKENQRQIEELKRLVAEGRLKECDRRFEVQMLHKDGSVVWLEVESKAVVDDRGRFVQLQGAARNVTERKLAQEALAASEARYRALFDSIRDAILVADVERKIVHGNQAFTDLFGYGPGEIAGKNTRALYADEEQYKDLGREIEKHRADENFFYTVVYRKKSGESFPGETNVFFLRDDKGEVSGHIGLIRDVTERIRTEKALTRTAERLAEAQKVAGVGDWNWDPETNAVTWSENLYRIFGLDPAKPPPDYEGQLALYHPEDAPRLDESVQRALNEGTPYELEMRRTNPDGETLTLDVRGVPQMDEQGNIRLLYGTVLDITERKRVEEELRARDRLLSVTLESTADGILVVDKRGAVTHYNERFLKLWNLSAENMRKGGGYLLRKVQDQLTEPEKFRQGVRRLYSGAETGFDTVRFNDGRLFEFYSSPLEEDGEIMGRLWSFRDVTEREQSRKDLASIFEMSLDLICIADIETATFTRVNPAFTRVLGWSEEELLDRPFLEFTHPEDVEPTVRVIEKALKRGEKVVNFENRYLCKDGSYRWLNWVSHPLPETGVTYAVARDVTDSKAAAEAIMRSEQRFRALFGGMRDAVFVHGFTDDGLPDRFEQVNQAACDRLGYEPEELLELSPLDINSPEAAATVTPEIAKVLRQSGEALFETVHVAGDGTRIPVEISAHTFEDRGRTMVMSIARDVTERKQAEERLKTSENQLARIIDFMPDPTLVIDANGRVMAWNRAIEKLTGVPKEEMLGKADHEYAVPFYGEQRPLLVDLVLEPDAELESRYAVLDRKEDIAVAETTVQGVDGGPRYLWGAATKLRDASGSVFGAIECIRDITEIKNKERDLEEAKRAAEAASHAKSEFLANMSHEIRTPLNGVLGMLQLLQTTRLDSEQQEYAQTAIQSSKRLTRLLSDILDLSRVEAGKLGVHAEPFDLAETVGQVAELFEPAARQAGLALRVQADPSIPRRLLGDAARLQQILGNLLGNAVKFTRKGEVTITVNSLPANRHDEYRALFSISDTGVGIEDDTLENLFEPFTQADEGFRREHQGAGLGLAICKRLVSLMGGNIAIASEVGKGTEVYFNVVFGTLDARTARVEQREVEARPPVSGLKILLAEDDEVSGFSAARQLEKAGCEVQVVEDGAKALQALRESDFDVVLMDVQMPVMDGVEATRAVRNGEAGAGKAGVPIIALTAYAMTGDRERFIKAGMDGYVTKPVNAETLQAELERVMNEA
jgi:PAS domain S-box-containing protein